MNKTSNYIKIFDTTLRDGEQSPGASMSLSEKIQIAEIFDTMGIDIIEAGFPIASEGDFESVSEVSKVVKNVQVCGLARAGDKDVDRAGAAVKHAVNPRIHTFIATSPIHMKYKLQMDEDQVIDAIHRSVSRARNLVEDVQWSAEDATRTDRDFLYKCVETAISSGASTINIPDTVGYTTPEEYFEIIDSLINNVPSADKVTFSTHCHNDLGLAVANSLSGVRAGARQIECTMNGIGERAGNASLEEFVMALHSLEFENKWETNINTKLIYETSRYISKLAGMSVQPNKAIVGENAFGHESGIHTHGVLNNPLTYEPISPEIVGRTRWLQVGKHAGIHGMNAMLKEYGIEPNEDQTKQILDKVKALGDQGKQVTEVELLSMANEVIGENKLKRIVQLAGFSVSTGVGTMPYAFVKLNVDGQEFSATDYGVGPVDAALNAIQKITSQVTDEVRLKEYKLDSISGGANALCEVTVKVEDARGNIISSKSVGEDIVTTSVQAMVDGINRIMLKNLLKEKKI